MAKLLQLQPEELRNEVWLWKDETEKSAWQMAVEVGHVELLEELSDWTK